jgi:hypothetical protein
MMDKWKKEIFIYVVLPFVFVTFISFLMGFWVGWRMGAMDMKGVMSGENKTYQVP